MPLVGRSFGHLLDIIDEIFVVADPGEVRAATCDTTRWSSWFPGASFTSYDDRGPLGERWTVAGALAGTAEVWLEAHGDGTIVHAYLRADPDDAERPTARRARARWVTRHMLTLKGGLFALKSDLEGDRAPGTTRVPLGERVVSASEQRSTTTEGASADGRPDDLKHRDRR